MPRWCSPLQSVSDALNAVSLVSNGTHAFLLYCLHFIHFLTVDIMIFLQTDAQLMHNIIEAQCYSAVEMAPLTDCLNFRNGKLQSCQEYPNTNHNGFRVGQHVGRCMLTLNKLCNGMF